MTITKSGSKLEEFYAYFKTFGTDRLNGLGESYFVGLTDSEKEEAWNYLVKDFASSSERITGMYNLDRLKAISLFKKAIALPASMSQIPAEQKAIESNRLRMLKYINSLESDEKYITAMCEFSKSQFVDVRTEFAQALPAHQVTSPAIEALKGMIFTETKTLAVTSAITKLMLIHGMEFDSDDSIYKSIYLSLRSDDPNEKIKGIKRLEQVQPPNFI